MNLTEALNNENSDELQKRIRLLDVSARDCPKRKNDRVEYLRRYLLSKELGIRIAQMTEAEQTMAAEVVRNQSGACGRNAASGTVCIDPDRIPARADWLWELPEKTLRTFLNGLRKLGHVLSADSTVV